ncbi:MAG TPA: S46 family peptidase [Bacteroidales bacterium]|nr:S46 family peptidase [Bacteroidales bacterium]
MIKKIIPIIIAVLMVAPSALKADEGMWLPFLIERLNYQDMKEQGLKLTPEEIYSVNNSSLKDAVIVFGGGCTGEVVSDQGLILTNHHCGYSYIQKHSSVEHDYLTDGFWAMAKEEELSNPGLTAKFLERIEDVSDRINEELNDEMTNEERNKKISEISKKIQEEATADTHFDASVRSFFKGNEFYLFVYTTYKDVRMVGAPPSSIGNFGGDTDNWMWPRHTGDFSMFRVYTAPDGTPAEYAEENVPMKPANHFEVSLNGVEEGDFAMIMGYPGGTQRYLTSHGVKMAINKKNPTIVDIRDKKLKVMKKAMDASKAVKIQYASKYARTANYWKYFQGQTKGLKRLKVADKKEKLEDDFREWVSGNEQRHEKYGEALELIEEGYKMQENTVIAETYFREAVFRGAEVLGFTLSNFFRLHNMLEEEAEEEKIQKRVEAIEARLGKYFKDYHAPLDQKMLGAMLEMFYNNVPKFQHPELLDKYYKKYDGDFMEAAADIFDKSDMDTKEGIRDLLDNPKERKIRKDPVFELASAFYDTYREISKDSQKSDKLLSKGYRKFVAGLREMNPEKEYYPDANFTMRLTYGKVNGYEPADAVQYEYYTTLDGVMEKEDPSDEEFIVHEKLSELYQDKDYGKYGDNGVMHTCFLTNHDITGGNSGSPVIDAHGRLIGIAFDGNWEAMSGDIAFEPELQRTISVDIRYVLFVIDKFAGAGHLVEEMDIVKTARPAKKMDADKAKEAKKQGSNS